MDLKSAIAAAYGDKLRSIAEQGRVTGSSRIDLVALTHVPDQPEVYHVDYEAVDSEINLMEGFLRASNGFEKLLHVSQMRAAFQELDNDYKWKLSGADSFMTQFFWSRTESEKAAALWQYATRAIKRRGRCLNDNINRLKAMRDLLTGVPSTDLALVSAGEEASQAGAWRGDGAALDSDGAGRGHDAEMQSHGGGNAGE